MEALAQNIRQLRVDHEMTQEELASLCQVTHVAISKWETGKTLPDITLLPILARIFEISIDELLNFKKTLSDEEVMAFSKEQITRFSQEPFEKAMQYTKNLIKTYPNSELLKLRVAGSFMNVALCVKDEAQLKLYQNYAIDLLESLFESNNLSIQQSARILQVSYLTNDNNIEEAYTKLLEIPKLTDTASLHASLLIRLERKTEAAKVLETYIYSHIHQIMICLHTLISLKPEQQEEIIELMEQVHHSFKLHGGAMGNLYMYYAKREDKERTLHHLSTFINQILEMDEWNMNMKDSFLHIPWFEDIEVSQPNYPKGKLKEITYQSLLEEPVLDFLKNDSSFLELLNQLI